MQVWLQTAIVMPFFNCAVEHDTSNRIEFWRRISPRSGRSQQMQTIQRALGISRAALLICKAGQQDCKRGYQDNWRGAISAIAAEQFHCFCDGSCPRNKPAQNQTYLDVRVGLANVVLISEVGNLLKVDGQDGHGWWSISNCEMEATKVCRWRESNERSDRKVREGSVSKRAAGEECGAKASGNKSDLYKEKGISLTNQSSFQCVEQAGFIYERSVQDCGVRRRMNLLSWFFRQYGRTAKNGA